MADGTHGTLTADDIQSARTNTNAVERSPLLVNGCSTSSKERLQHARRLLYVSHFFSQFSENAWQFCLILFLAAFANYSSLILVSTYGLTSGIAVCLTGSKAGRFIDGTNRLFVARTFIWTENVSVLIATLFCYFLLASRAEDANDREAFHASLNGPAWSYWFRSRLDGVPLDALSVVMLIGIHLLGSVARILDQGFIVAMERDWIVVMSQSSHGYEEAQASTEHGPNATARAWLSTTNVTMKQIDLSCKVAAPAVAGFIIGAFDNGTDPHHGGDLSVAALWVGFVNVAALVVEYVCTARIYALIPDLAVKEARPCPTSSQDASEFASTPSTAEENTDEIELTNKGCGIGKSPDGLKEYLDQPISLGGISIALL
jgi:hypothetical protein